MRWISVLTDRFQAFLATADCPAHSGSHSFEVDALEPRQLMTVEPMITNVQFTPDTAESYGVTGTITGNAPSYDFAMLEIDPDGNGPQGSQFEYLSGDGFSAQITVPYNAPEVSLRISGVNYTEDGSQAISTEWQSFSFTLPEAPTGSNGCDSGGWYSGSGDYGYGYGDSSSSGSGGYGSGYGESSSGGSGGYGDAGSGESSSSSSGSGSGSTATSYSSSSNPNSSSTSGSTTTGVGSGLSSTTSTGSASGSETTGSGPASAGDTATGSGSATGTPTSAGTAITAGAETGAGTASSSSSSSGSSGVESITTTTETTSTTSSVTTAAPGQISTSPSPSGNDWDLKKWFEDVDPDYTPESLDALLRDHPELDEFVRLFDRAYEQSGRPNAAQLEDVYRQAVAVVGQSVVTAQQTYDDTVAQINTHFDNRYRQADPNDPNSADGTRVAAYQAAMTAASDAFSAAFDASIASVESGLESAATALEAFFASLPPDSSTGVPASWTPPDVDTITSSVSSFLSTLSTAGSTYSSAIAAAEETYRSSSESAAEGVIESGQTSVSEYIEDFGEAHSEHDEEVDENESEFAKAVREAKSERDKALAKAEVESAKAYNLANSEHHDEQVRIASTFNDAMTAAVDAARSAIASLNDAYRSAAETWNKYSNPYAYYSTKISDANYSDTPWTPSEIAYYSGFVGGVDAGRITPSYYEDGSLVPESGSGYPPLGDVAGYESDAEAGYSAGFSFAEGLRDTNPGQTFREALLAAGNALSTAHHAFAGASRMAQAAATRDQAKATATAHAALSRGGLERNKAVTAAQHAYAQALLTASFAVESGNSNAEHTRDQTVRGFDNTLQSAETSESFDIAGASESITHAQTTAVSGANQARESAVDGAIEGLMSALFGPIAGGAASGVLDALYGYDNAVEGTMHGFLMELLGAARAWTMTQQAESFGFANDFANDRHAAVMGVMAAMQELMLAQHTAGALSSALGFAKADAQIETQFRDASEAADRTYAAATAGGSAAPPAATIDSIPLPQIDDWPVNEELGFAVGFTEMVASAAALPATVPSPPPPPPPPPASPAPPVEPPTAEKIAEILTRKAQMGRMYAQMQLANSEMRQSFRSAITVHNNVIQGIEDELGLPRGTYSDPDLPSLPSAPPPPPPAPTTSLAWIATLNGLDIAAGEIPIAGSFYDLYKAVSGHNPITGADESSIADRLANIYAAVPGAGAAAKGVGAVAKGLGAAAAAGAIASLKKVAKSSTGDVFEESVKQTFRSKIIRQNEKLLGPDGKQLGEIDFETPEAIAEVGISLAGKLSQLHKLAEVASARQKQLWVIYGPETPFLRRLEFEVRLKTRWGSRVRFIPHE